MNGTDLKTLFALTLRQPMPAARQILAMNFPLQIRWGFAVLVVVLAAILAWLVGLMVPAPQAGTGAAYAWVAQSPLLLAGMQMAAVVVTAGLMTIVGRMLGGSGRFEDALILTAWIEAVLLAIQALQLVLLFVLPAFASLLSIFAAVLFFYLLVQFTKSMHGLTSGWKVFFAFIAAIFALAFALSFIAAAFGLIPEVQV